MPAAIWGAADAYRQSQVNALGGAVDVAGHSAELMIEAGTVGCGLAAVDSETGVALRNKAPSESAGWRVGPHGDMPSPRPAGFESHHGVNSAWMEANVAGYEAGKAPGVLMPNVPNHNATRSVFNRIRSDIAVRQGVSPRNVDWSQVHPGTAWRLAEEQFQAAQTPSQVRVEYWRQFNGYLDSLK